MSKNKKDNDGALKFADLPVNQKQWDATRDELKSAMTSFHVEVRADFKKVEARFDKIETVIEKQNEKFHRTNALFEEMLNQNKMILDAVVVNNQRLDRVERAVSRIVGSPL